MSRKKPFALIVEDDEDLSTIFSEVLEADGFQTEIIRNGQLALDRLQVVTPEVVSLDMHLPGVSGLDILKFIRAEKRLLLTDIVVTTADEAILEQVRDLADFVLLKPISFGQLRNLTARLKSDPCE
jgi:DNA-binding response OmpR family regulator